MNDDDQAGDVLAAAVRSIAYGTVSGPTGLEALAMALTGEGPFSDNNLSQAIASAGEAIGDGLYAIAAALRGQDEVALHLGHLENKS